LDGHRHTKIGLGFVGFSELSMKKKRVLSIFVGFLSVFKNQTLKLVINKELKFGHWTIGQPSSASDKIASARLLVEQIPLKRSDKLGRSDSFGQLGSLSDSSVFALTFGQLGQLGQSRAELPNDETHPVQPIKMTFSFLFLTKSRFIGVTVSRIAVL
jgi:hypothetical protein